MNRHDSTTNHIFRNSAILHPICRSSREPFGNLLQGKEAVLIPDSVGLDWLSDDDLLA